VAQLLSEGHAQIIEKVLRVYVFKIRIGNRFERSHLRNCLMLDKFYLVGIKVLLIIFAA